MFFDINNTSYNAGEKVLLTQATELRRITQPLGVPAEQTYLMKYLGKSEQGVHPSRVHALIYLFLQILKPSEKKAKYQYSGLNSGRPVTPLRAQGGAKKGK